MLLLLLLLAAPAPAAAAFGERPIGPGDRSHDVRVLQSWLTRIGIKTAVDGVYGRATTRSVRRFERREGRPVDGRVAPPDAQLLRARLQETLRGTGSAEGTPRVFPVRGRHDFGGADARFGASRRGHTHQGQDVFARCGTPVVAAEGGSVEYAGYHAAAGNYAVVAGAASGEDYVYMHLREAAAVTTGAGIATGQAIGAVGESGNASGCHLHFELWSAPGWYKGGRPYDPLPALRAWDAAS
jgi:murein DD-endopeptidase MepM/ murein hydrolase activator NlpD